LSVGPGIPRVPIAISTQPFARSRRGSIQIVVRTESWAAVGMPARVALANVTREPERAVRESGDGSDLDDREEAPRPWHVVRVVGS